MARDVDAKLKRAEHHLRKLEKTAQGVRVANLVETWTDRDRKGRVRIRVKQIGEIPPQWHVRIGECVHDMRSALDHLAYGLNIIGSGQDPPPNHRRSQFPIYSNRNAFRTGGGRARPAKDLIEHFPRGARTAIEGLQPYHRRQHHPITNQRLSDLAELANIDKHRRFPVTAVSPRSLPIPSVVGGHLTNAYTYRYRLLEPNTTILWLEVPALPRNVKHPNVNFAFMASIEFVGALANPPIRLLVPHEPVIFTLDSILTVIREGVLPVMGRFVPGSGW